MPQSNQSDHEPGLPQPAFRAGSLIRDECRAARIGEVTQFAQCLVETNASCPHRLTFSAYLYCLHPEREAIIARTLTQDGPPGK